MNKEGKRIKLIHRAAALCFAAATVVAQTATATQPQGTGRAVATAADKNAPIEVRLSALQSLKETKGSDQPDTLSALADLILKEKEPRVRMAAIHALDAFDWSADEHALAALVLAREENGAARPHFKPATRALTSEQMGQRTSYDHVWDFDTVWQCRKGDAYPVLQKHEASKGKRSAGGTGTEDDPFLVATAEQLDDIRNKLGSDQHFRQVRDIDLAGYGDPQKGWDPIGRGEAIGSYDGGGYTIRNLFINRPNVDNVGFFGSLLWGKDDAPGRLSRIALENVTIVGRNRTGALAGHLGDAHAKASAQTVVKNCYASGTVSGASIAGGLAGQVFSCQVIQCHVAVAVRAADGQSAPFVQRLWWGAAAQNCFYNADLAGTKTVAIAALQALRRVKPRLDTTSYLFQLLRADDAFLRAKAAELALGVPPNRKLIKALLDDRYVVSRLARQVADSYENESKQQIISALAAFYDRQNYTPKQRVQLARAAGELSTESSVALLIRMLTDPSADVRRAAIEGLQWMGITDPSRDNTIGPQSVWWTARPEEAGRTAAALQPMATNDPDASCREAAAAALARITGEGLSQQNPAQAVLSEDASMAMLPEPEKDLLKTTYAEVDACRQTVLEKFAAGVAWPYTSGARVYHASAHLYLNRNLEAANRRLMEDTELGAYGSEVGGLVSPLWSLIYGLYNSRSPHLPGRLTSETEQLFKQRFFTYLKWNSKESFDDYIGDIWKLKGTENHHVTFGPTTWYLYLGYLKQDPEYAQRELYDGKTVTEWCDAWGDYWKQWLEARALKGLWIEMGAGYAKYSYPGILALYVGAEDPQVRRRAEMFLDLSFIEEAQISYGNMRGGGKSRASMNPLSGIGHILPVLYGEGVLLGHYGLHEAVISGYRPPMEAMLIRKQYELPETPIIIANRRPGEVDAEGALKAESALVNYGYKTRHFLLGSILRAPHTKTSPLFGQNLRSGLLFASGEGIFPNPESVGRYMDPYYSFQHENVMVLQKNKGAKNTTVGIYVKPKAKKVERDGWVFVDDGQAYGAIRVLEGGYHWDGKGANVLPDQELAPMLIQGGDADGFGSFDQFMAAVLGNTITWDGEKVEYAGPNQTRIEFFSRPVGKLPRVAGRDYTFLPAAAYESPFLNSEAGTSTATVTVGSLKTVYDFENSEIIRNQK